MSFRLNIGEVKKKHIEFIIKFIHNKEKDTYLFIYKVKLNSRDIPFSLIEHGEVKDEVEVLTVNFLKFLAGKEFTGEPTLHIRYDGDNTLIFSLIDDRMFIFKREGICDFVGSVKRLILRYLDKNFNTSLKGCDNHL